jgi:lysyl-tRNA synthetase class II
LKNIGYFIADDLIGTKIAYERFSYDIEKAWCNITVQETIRDERASDKSKTAQSDPQYGNFERLAKEYLETDGESCKDLDSGAATTQKKKKKKSR